jgi:putative ABC transport system substrate-binding protein
MIRTVAAAVLLLLSIPWAYAQQTGKSWRIGFLGPPPSTGAHLVAAFREGLRELGYVEGKNIVIEHRTTAGKDELAHRLAAELVALKVDVLVVSITQNAVAAKRATSIIPIVMVNVGDPVESGLVSSLARPGGNITGLSRLTAETIGKNLEVLAEAVPQAERVAVLWNRSNPLHPAMMARAKEAATALGLALAEVQAGAPAELEEAFAVMVNERVNSVLVLADGMYFLNRRDIAELALRRRLPTMFQNSEHVQAGGLLSYSADSVDNYRRAATYVDKILKGAKPGDLPIQQPERFELVVNLNTADKLGLRLPAALLLRADVLIR